MVDYYYAIPIAVPIIMAAASLASSGINAAASRSNAKHQMEMQSELIRQQNEYNTPANQMARFKEAGLNPYLAYSQGNAGNQSQIADYQSDAFHTDVGSALSQGVGMLSQFQDMKVKQAQVDNLEAQSENVRQETSNAQLDAIMKGYNNKIRNFDLFVKSQTYPYEIEQQYRDLIHRVNENENSLLEGQLMRYQKDYLYPAQLSNTRAETALRQFNLNNILPLQAQGLGYENKIKASQLPYYQRGINFTGGNPVDWLARLIYNWRHGISLGED